MIKRIGVLTSGGDAPGMNAAIRSIVKYGIYEGLEIYGIYNGYLGLFQNKISKLDYHSVSNIINRGGTILGSTRFLGFMEEKIRVVAIKNMIRKLIDALIVIGGEGSYLGAKKLSEMGFPCIGLPGSIDNDIAGTDYSIGYFTALETIIEAIDRLRDTSLSHQRISIVEIMGRYCGDLTISAAIAGGCEFIILPKLKFKIGNLIKKIKSNFIKNNKKHAIIAITENVCNVFKLAEYIQSNLGLEARATVLGHIQRGGSPTAFDRILASRMGVYSVELLLKGYKNYFIGIKNNKLIHYHMNDILQNKKSLFSKDLLKIADKLL